MNDLTLIMPEIQCEISIIFNNELNANRALQELGKCGINNIEKCKPIFDHTVSLSFASVKNEHFWEVSDALIKMFSLVRRKLSRIKRIAKEYKGEMHVGIVVYHYGTYTAIVIDGDNMKKISFLGSGISLDLYDYSEKDQSGDSSESE